MTQKIEDLRVRRTHKLLREAFIDLIEERNFETITVGEIAERAMVSRAAFYRHYQDKYDLVEKIFAEALQNLTNGIGPAPSNDSAADLPEPWVRLFEHFGEYARLYHAMLGEKGSCWFVAKVRTCLAEAMSERIELTSCSTNKQQPVAPGAFVLDLIASMFVEVIRWWLEHDRPYTPRQAAMYCSRLAASILNETSTWSISGEQADIGERIQRLSTPSISAKKSCTTKI